MLGNVPPLAITLSTGILIILVKPQLGENIGACARSIKNFGFKEGISSQLSMSLGSGLVSLLEITNAYAVIANGGIKIKKTLIQNFLSILPSYGTGGAIFGNKKAAIKINAI